MVKDTGRRDSAGLEDMDAFFSPTAAKSPKLLVSSKTPFLTALQGDETLSMSGTSSTLVLAERCLT
jgi:Kinetochore CENP-C fungal homologue, Mif2, N-terminal